MKLEKTGQVVKLDPSYITVMWKFSEDFIQWEPEEYFRCVGREGVNGRPTVVVSRDLKIEPSFILLPVYKYSLTFDNTVVERLGIEFKYDDSIRLENLSLFNVYKVIKDVDPEVGVRITVGITTSTIVAENKTTVELDDVGIEFKVGSNWNYPLISLYWGRWYNHYLNTLRWAKGRKWSDFSAKPMGKSKVVEHLYTIEVSMLAFINFFYALYTGLKDNTVEYRLFKPYMELLQSYGNTFEEAIATLKEMLVLVE
jgi:hypothetical protein